jgi:flagellar biosynthesis/type III secretory pathway chaperone
MLTVKEVFFAELCNMKMSNEDLKKITEIKQYLLDPPVTFKLNEYALVYLKDAVTILTPYTNANEITNQFKDLIGQLENKEIMQDELRSTLKEAGIKISQLTSR